MWGLTFMVVVALQGVLLVSFGCCCRFRGVAWADFLWAYVGDLVTFMIVV